LSILKPVKLGKEMCVLGYLTVKSGNQFDQYSVIPKKLKLEPFLLTLIKTFSMQATE